MSERLVAAGAFRVDRARALKGLESYQLADPEAFILEWCRCAIGGRARRIQIDESRGLLEMRFDGWPFAADELKDPYAPLLAEKRPDRGRGIDLALGLLAVFRLEPKEVRIISGSPRNRLALSARSPKAESLAASADASRGTILQVAWGWRRSLAAKTVQDTILANDSLRMSPIPVVINGSLVPRGPESKEAHRFKDRGIRGWLIGSAAGDGVARLQACKLGVRAGTIEVPLPFGRFSGWVNCDDFSLNISRSDVVADAALDRVRDAVSAEFRRLLRKIIDREAPNLARLAKRLFKDRDWVAASGGKDRVGDPSIIHWVREGFRAFRTKGWPVPPELLKDLRGLPVLCSAAGTPLTVENLLERAAKRGGIPYFTVSGPMTSLDHVVMCPTPADVEWLTACFPGQTRLAG